MHAITCAKCGEALNRSDEFCSACGEPAAQPGVEAAPAEPSVAAGLRLPLADPAELEQLRADTLGRYDILGELGRGGMATVYLAHEIALDRKVAIKVMSPALALGDGVERFKREARTSASLSHPNIIPIYAVHHSEQLLYFVMKYVEGRPLDTIIRELGTLPIPMVQAILGQVASAFGYAHRRGVVHRDIKPGNILIDDEGWAVVTDFGIAKVAEGEQLTQTGLAVGTPTYMSPEQVTAQPVTGASDQYSLGVVAYEMLTGKPPFHGGGTMAMMYAHVHQPPPPIERADCPEALRDAVMRMLAKAPEDRWPSVEDAITAIGAPPLTYDDPTRSQLIALARTGAQQRLEGVPRTPRSPIPLLRTPAPRSGVSASASAPSSEAASVPGAGEPSARAPRPSAAVRLKRQSRLSLALAAGGVAVAVLALVLRPRPTAVPPASADTAASAAAPASSETEALPPGVSAEDTMPARAPRAAQQVPARAPSEARGQHAGGAPSRPAAARVTRDSAVAAASPAPAPAAPPVDSSPAAPAPAPHPAAASAANAAEPTASAAPVPASGASALLGTNFPGTAASRAASAARKEVEQAIRAYAAAIDNGNAGEAQRLFPGMPPAQRSYLANLFEAGGHMQTRWKASDIAITGDSATARVRGTTRTLPANGAPSEDRVDSRVVLHRVGGSWQLQSF